VQSTTDTDIWAALEYMRPGDMLTVQDADRLGRNLVEGLIMLNELFSQGIAVKSSKASRPGSTPSAP
jgi:DNA invertase Pin-like site-specific DNA recombinase